MSIVGQLFFVPVLFLVGAIFLFAPARVQKTYAKAASFEAAKRFIESSDYLLLLRSIGLVLCIASLALLYVSL